MKAGNGIAAKPSTPVLRSHVLTEKHHKPEYLGGLCFLTLTEMSDDR